MGSYRPGVGFTDKSNNREDYIKKLERFKSKPKRWCKIHPSSYWGEGYTQCAQGFERREFCKKGE